MEIRRKSCRRWHRGPARDPIAADDCLIGDWMLDVADYGAQSRGLPDRTRHPDHRLRDGRHRAAVLHRRTVRCRSTSDLVTSGTIVAGDAVVPISVPSHYGASGTWSRPESEVDAIDHRGLRPRSSMRRDDSVPVPPLLRLRDQPARVRPVRRSDRQHRPAGRRRAAVAPGRRCGRTGVSAGERLRAGARARRSPRRPRGVVVFSPSRFGLPAPW